jgi:predicted nucleic acid-binding protein
MQSIVGIRKPRRDPTIAPTRSGLSVAVREAGRAVTVVVDSDILIEVLIARNASIVLKWTELSESDALILFSPVIAAELWAGSRPSEYAALDALFDALACIPADESIRRRAGEYIRLYRKSHAVELGDAVIAASAVINDAQLWTRNRKHYPMREITFFD